MRIAGLKFLRDGVKANHAKRRNAAINKIMAKVKEMCKQAEEDQCVQPATWEELEFMLQFYVK